MTHGQQAPPPADSRKRTMAERLNGNVNLQATRILWGVVQGVVLVVLLGVGTMLLKQNADIAVIKETMVTGADLRVALDAIENPPGWFRGDVENLEDRVLDLERARQDE